MNKKTLHIFLLLLLFATSAFADTTQTITINGETVEQVATKLTFNGDKVIITYSNGENSGEVVYNTSGSIVASVKSSGNSAQIDINGQPSGIYLLKAGKQVVKFIKR